MAIFEIAPLLRTTPIGFDRAWEQLSSVLQIDGSTYPAYDVVVVGNDRFRISLAVPGYAQDELSIETREGLLSIKGTAKQARGDERYLHRGIATHGFERTFRLPEHVSIETAKLTAGILHLDLVRELPEALRPRRIEISEIRDERSAVEEQSAAA